MKPSIRLATLTAILLSSGALAACGAGDSPAPTSTLTAAGGFDATLRAARGQTVRFWLYGGDDRVNAYVDVIVAPAARRLGVTVRRVPVTDTADAVQRVVAQRRAGKSSGGAVDLIWLNGENFASGKSAGLWLKNWATALPNARRYVDPGDPSIRTDFQVPVEGQESPWQRAAFVFAHDGAKVGTPPRDLDALLAYARQHPGRVTYPAPPDFTGSAFVRQVVAEKGEDAAFAYLKALKPHLYREGTTYPKSEAELNTLFGDGKVDFAMSYDAAFVSSAVRKGQFPPTARPFLLGDGALQNTSYVTIPADAAHQEGALVLADLLLSPALQAAKLKPSSLGNPTVLDLARLGPQRRLFDAASEPVPPRGPRHAGARAGRRQGRAAGASLDARGAARLVTRSPAAGRWRERALLVPAVLTIALLFGGAIAGAIRTSVVPLGGHASLDAWRALLHDPGFADAVLFTLRTAFVSTALAAMLAVAVALMVARRRHGCPGAGRAAGAGAAPPRRDRRSAVAGARRPGRAPPRRSAGHAGARSRGAGRSSPCTSTRRRRSSCCSCSPRSGALSASGKRRRRRSEHRRGSGCAG